MWLMARRKDLKELELRIWWRTLLHIKIRPPLRLMKYTIWLQIQKLKPYQIHLTYLRYYPTRYPLKEEWLCRRMGIHSVIFDIYSLGPQDLVIKCWTTMSPYGHDHWFAKFVLSMKQKSITALSHRIMSRSKWFVLLRLLRRLWSMIWKNVHLVRYRSNSPIYNSNIRDCHSGPAVICAWQLATMLQLN